MSDSDKFGGAFLDVLSSMQKKVTELHEQQKEKRANDRIKVDAADMISLVMDGNGYPVSVTISDKFMQENKDVMQDLIAVLFRRAKERVEEATHANGDGMDPFNDMMKAFMSDMD